MCKRGVKGLQDPTAGHRKFSPEPAYSQEDNNEGKAQARGERREAHDQSNKHFLSTDQWGQVVQLTIYEAKNGNLKGLCLALTSVNRGTDIRESYLSHRRKDGFCSKPFSRTQREGRFLNFPCFLGSVKIQIVILYHV